MKKSIYKITNLINNKCYIGQTNNITRRFQEHKNMKSIYNEEVIDKLENVFIDGKRFEFNNKVFF